MLVQTNVGPSISAAGVNATLRGSNLGDGVFSELHGRYALQTLNGNVFYAASQSVATTTVGLATTYTGLCLSNPVGSNVNIVLLKASVMQSVIQSTQPEAYALATGFNSSTNVTHTAALVTHPSLVGSSATSVGLADTSATLPTAPFYTHFLHNTGTATANGTGITVDLEGSIVLKPGAYAAFVTPAQASVAGLWFSLSWEEVPVAVA